MDKDKIQALIKLLGEENVSRLKKEITDIIVESVRDDINDYNRVDYLLCPDDIIGFVNECKEEAFAKIKDDVVNQMVEKIKKSL